MKYTVLGKKSLFSVFCGILMIASCLKTSGQDDTLKSTLDVEADTSNIKLKKHSPHKATIYSLVIPGLGQAYNKKYWKIPIIYAGFGTLWYFIQYNNKEYKKFKEAYYHSLIAGDSLPPVNDYEEKFNSEDLLNNKNYFRRNRDFTYILTGIWYLLNVIDATVDAHLYNWEIDEDLSLRVEPDIRYINFGQNYSGFRLTLSF